MWLSLMVWACMQLNSLDRKFKCFSWKWDLKIHIWVSWVKSDFNCFLTVSEVERIRSKIHKRWWCRPWSDNRHSSNLKSFFYSSTLLKSEIDRLLHKSRPNVLENRNITAIILIFIETAPPLNHQLINSSRDLHLLSFLCCLWTSSR